MLKVISREQGKSGEPIFLSEIRDMIRKTNGVVDILKVKLTNKVGRCIFRSPL